MTQNNPNIAIGLQDDPKLWTSLLPLTFVRNIAQCRIGILTIQEKWELLLNTKTVLKHAVPHLTKHQSTTPTNIDINAAIIPSEALAHSILHLPENSKLYYNDIFIASHSPNDSFQTIEYHSHVYQLTYPWEIFLWCDRELRHDFEILTAGRKSQAIEPHSTAIGSDIFIEEGAKISCAILNATTGPIYIGKNAEILEGSMIRGPFALGENSQLKMGTKIYGATSIGPHCKVGGEITNSVIFGYSNKAHDGYLGNSVIATWCNLGADTNTSNLKNNYSPVAIFSYLQDKFIDTEQQFCGLIMGDYSKCGINTMFNTGTVVGVCANIFGAGFPFKHIPSFSWCSIEQHELYQLDKALQTIKVVYKRRGLTLSAIEEEILTDIYTSINFDPNEK